MTPPARRILLSEYTTLRLGGPAGRFVEAETEQQVVAELRAASQRGEPVLVLGGGSNLVIADAGFPGTVVRIVTRGIELTRAEHAGGDDGVVTVTAAAGEGWDEFSERCVAEALTGVECLGGIPGLVGATPIQNVGAYGQDVAETIATVRAYDRDRDAVLELSGEECGFGYRTSMFKHSQASRSAQPAPAGQPAPAAAYPAATGRFVVLGVTFRLAGGKLSQPIRYAELARKLGIAQGERVPLGDARAAVLDLRRGKGMVIDASDPDTRSAGSFFTNPVISQAQLAALEREARARFGPGTEVPRFPAGGGLVKLPAAWLIERAGFTRGYAGRGVHAGHAGREPRGGGHAGPAGRGGVRVSTRHTLALVNAGGGSTADLIALAAQIRDRVSDVFGVRLTAEPVLVGVTL